VELSPVVKVNEWVGFNDWKNLFRALANKSRFRRIIINERVKDRETLTDLDNHLVTISLA
jgi:hypothetical protein